MRRHGRMCPREGYLQRKPDPMHAVSIPKLWGLLSMSTVLYKRLALTSAFRRQGFATCNNSDGSFSCSCDDGWTGGGTNCISEDSAIAILSLEPTADGFVVDNSKFQRESSFAALSFRGKDVLVQNRDVDRDEVGMFQFDAIPRGVKEARLELTKSWDGSFCRNSKYVLHAVHGDIVGSVVRRWEEFNPALLAEVDVSKSPGRVLLDVSDFVRAATTNSSRLAFWISSVEYGCFSSFRSSEHESTPYLHLAFDTEHTLPTSQQELARETLLEPTTDVSRRNDDGAQMPRTLLEVNTVLGSDSMGTLLRFENVPTDLLSSHLVLSKLKDESAQIGCNEDSFEIRAFSHNGTDNTIVDESSINASQAFRITVTRSLRIQVIDVTHALRAAIPHGGDVSLLLSATDPGCDVGFGSSRTTGNPYVVQSLKADNKPYLRIQHQYKCGGCVFNIEAGGILKQHGSCSTESAACRGLVLEDVGIRSISKGTFNGMVGLRLLDLSKNSMESIAEGVLCALSELEQLDLSYNLISHLDGACLSQLKSLTRLSLQYNRLSTIKPNLFLPLTLLTSLHLQNNRLRDVEIDAFQGLPNLIWLNLNANDLTYLDTAVFVSLKVQGIGLNDNPLTCVPAWPSGKSCSPWIVLLAMGEYER